MRTTYGMTAQAVLDEDPSYVLELIGWLPDAGPYAASVRGGRQFHGWGQDRTLLADLWDATVAIGVAGSKKKPPRYPRPEARKKKRTWRTFIEMLKAEQEADQPAED